jgi:hypothetical protein
MSEKKGDGAHGEDSPIADEIRAETGKAGEHEGRARRQESADFKAKRSPLQSILPLDCGGHAAAFERESRFLAEKPAQAMLAPSTIQPFSSSWSEMRPG